MSKKRMYPDDKWLELFNCGLNSTEAAEKLGCSRITANSARKRLKDDIKIPYILVDTGGGRVSVFEPYSDKILSMKEWGFNAAQILNVLRLDFGVEGNVPALRAFISNNMRCAA